MTNESNLPGTPSRQSLEETPGRALKFLGAVGRTLGIRAALSAHGYDADEHRSAWDLLHKVSGYPGEQDPGVLHDVRAREAVAALDGWDERGFKIAGAALKHRHPVQHAYVFDNLAPAQGTEAVLSVRTFLDRLDGLAGDPGRVATRDADAAALSTLAKRGIDAAERARLWGLVKAAQAVTAPAADNQERLQHLTALHAWIEEWTETARAVIQRRDYLVTLGILRRRVKKKTAGTTAPAVGSARQATGAAGPTAQPQAAPTNGAPAAT
jgi:hypothetical protein